ncbi:Spy/CpxP family protein refolding chaperone [Asaia bogorensis]|uniref:Spy/CpxP family protein refolding chaperone n=1 Tax=Asaia bogorensis TaxID=91915 RepID=UPI000EFB9FB3|nr:periplasmic heavy metal sensor [Asaia bogorensis]
MISKKTFCMLALAAAPSFAAIAYAHAPAPVPNGPVPPPPGHMGMMMPPPLMGMLRGVDLTKEQRDKIHALMHAHRQDRREAMHQRRDLDTQIGALLLAKGPVDKAKLDGLIKQKEALNAKDEEAMAADAVAIHDVLTPEQLDKARVTQDKLDALEGQIRDLLRPPHVKGAADKDDDDAP